MFRAISLPYFFDSLDRLFDPRYRPNEQDIIHCRARSTGITETTFRLRDHEMLMVDVGGQKSERRKWIHCFQDVTSILFLVSLSGYDQCLFEDRDAVSSPFSSSRQFSQSVQNQMQDAMTIWDSICHSQWFKHTSIVRDLRSLVKQLDDHATLLDPIPEQERPFRTKDSTFTHQEFLSRMSRVLCATDSLTLETVLGFRRRARRRQSRA